MSVSSDAARPQPTLAERLRRIWDGIAKFVSSLFSRQNGGAQTLNAAAEEISGSDDQPEPNPTEDERPESPETDDPFRRPLTLSTLLDWLQNAANLSRSPFFKMGYKCGRDGSHHTHGTAAIESGFDALIKSADTLKEVFGKEIREAQHQLAYLQQEIARLDAAFDDQNPNSEAGRLRQEIQTLRDEINTHLQAQYNDRFVRDHEHIMEERKQTELEFIAQMKERVMQKGAELNNITDSEERKEKEKELEQEQANVSKRYTKLAATHKSDVIAVPGSTRILLNAIFFLLVLGGEFFIIYHLTRQVLGMDAAFVGSENPAVKSLLANAVFLFCIAFPLALGVLVKYNISKASDRPKTTRRVLRVICSSSLLMIAGIAVLNPTFLSHLPTETTDALHQTVEPALLYIYALIFFGITLLFSGVAGILYVELIEGYEQFCNARKKSPFEVLSLTDDDRFVQQREQQIKEREEKLEQIQQKREQARQKVSESQGLASIDLSKWNLAETLEDLKKAAVAAFRFGYQYGLNELMNKKGHDPAALLDMAYARKIMKHYLKIFDENP